MSEENKQEDEDEKEKKGKSLAASVITTYTNLKKFKEEKLDEGSKEEEVNTDDSK